MMGNMPAVSCERKDGCVILTLDSPLQKLVIPLHPRTARQIEMALNLLHQKSQLSIPVVLMEAGNS